MRKHTLYKYKSLRRKKSKHSKTQSRKNKYNKTRRNHKRIKGGNYLNTTDNILDGLPVNSNKVVITVPGHGTMNEKEYKKYLENINIQGSDMY